MNFPARSMPAIFLAIASLSACAMRASHVDLYGTPAVPSDIQPAIVIDSQTRYVNVEGVRTVRFLVGDKTFAWSFNVARTVHAFDLKEVAPPGVLGHSVIAMVSPDPKYVTF